MAPNARSAGSSGAGGEFRGGAAAGEHQGEGPGLGVGEQRRRDEMLDMRLAGRPALRCRLETRDHAGGAAAIGVQAGRGRPEQAGKWRARCRRGVVQPGAAPCQQRCELVR
ncbi:hypothetical protein GCM10011504_33040 [Siccirubricoccus deserti]|nr:hypothetical protein GCM10011504_33040 [Siccirubricoccus deserti]